MADPQTIEGISVLQDEVEMSLFNHSIIIAPIKENPRQSWFDGYNATNDKDAWNGFVALPNEEDEWEW